ncbi:MAG: GIY-YIG nuclease family protein [Gemmataceae bacterium]|nr:GIY-YIG nuclease family protein [Gemmataceae bacterium]
MDGLFSLGPFVDFGPSILCPDRPVPQLTQVHGQCSPQLRAQVKLMCPKGPGVYGMLDRHGQLIYVGKAKSLRTRLLGYFRTKSRDPKAGKILCRARTIVWECCAHEFAALLRELELIRRWRPQWNVQGQPLRRRQAFICVGRAPAPYVFMSPKPSGRADAVFGPVPASMRTREAIRRINDFYLLRDCPQKQEMIFADQADLFEAPRSAGCLRMEMGACLGPCVGAAKRSAYHAQARTAKRFLAGLDDAPLRVLGEQMADAAEKQQFERAALLRDKYATLEWLWHRLDRVRQAQREMSFVYPAASAEGTVTWHLIHGARVIASLPAPIDGESAATMIERLDGIYRGSTTTLLECYEHADGMALTMGWFRKHPEQMRRTLTPDDARAQCKAMAQKKRKPRAA